MRTRRRFGVRAQLTFIVLLGAILSTVATLFVANQAIQSYALQQARNQEQENMNIATLVLHTQYGQNVSIAANNMLVADSPTSGMSLSSLSAATNYGKYQLDGDTDYVDQVKQLIGGYVSIFKCADASGKFLLAQGQTACPRIATTFTTSANVPAATAATQTSTTAISCTATDSCLPLPIITQMALVAAAPHSWLGIDQIDGKQYYADYSPILNPQQRLIGVLFVGVPLDAVTAFQQRTTIELVLLGIIIMIAGIILALLFASAIISTLQRAARQVSHASERIGGISAQQTGGAAQQVWAVNAINKALQNFADMARDIAQRTDQLALMGNQVIQRRGEIAPAEIDSILAYITRSVRDISVASRQQASQYERMTGAMQAVIEIAEQVAGNSQQATESAQRLDQVVGELQQLVGMPGRGTGAAPEGAGVPQTGAPGATRSAAAPAQPTVRAVRPQRGAMPAGANRGLPAGVRGPMPAAGTGPRMGGTFGQAMPLGAAAEGPALGGQRGARPLSGHDPRRVAANNPYEPLAGAGARNQHGSAGTWDGRMPPLPPMPDDSEAPADAHTPGVRGAPPWAPQQPASPPSRWGAPPGPPRGAAFPVHPSRDRNGSPWQP